MGLEGHRRLIQHPLDRTGTCERIPRSQITEAPYNPRTLTADQKRRLKTVLETHGLCSPLVWNKRTGVLCGGHQRLSVLDSLAPEKEWAVPVTIVDLDEARERELNIALNNSDAGGQYDFAKLGNLFKDTTIKIDIASTGFDPGKLQSIIPDIAASIPSLNATLQANSQGWKDEKKATTERVEAAYQRMADRADQPSEPRAEYKPEDRHEEKIHDTDDLFYIVVVYEDWAKAAHAKGLMGVAVDGREVDGRILTQILQEWKNVSERK